MCAAFNTMIQAVKEDQELVQEQKVVQAVIKALEATRAEARLKALNEEEKKKVTKEEKKKEERKIKNHKKENKSVENKEEEKKKKKKKEKRAAVHATISTQDVARCARLKEAAAEEALTMLRARSGVVQEVVLRRAWFDKWHYVAEHAGEEPHTPVAVALDKLHDEGTEEAMKDAFFKMVQAVHNDHNKLVKERGIQGVEGLLEKGKAPFSCVR